MTDQTDILEQQLTVSDTTGLYYHVLTRIRLRARRRITWLRKLWTETSAAAESETFNLHSEVDGYLRNHDTYQAELSWLLNEPEMADLNNLLGETESYLLEENSSRLAILRDVFGLKEPEMDMIQCCLALSLDPNLGRVYAYLHDHNGRGYASNQLVARLFNYGPYIVLGSSSPLIVWGLIREIDMGRSEPMRIELDPYIRNWLLGSDDIDTALSDFSTIQPVHRPLPYWPVKQISVHIRKLFTAEFNQAVRVFITGQDGSGRRSMAAVISSGLAMQLLTIDTQRLSALEWQPVFMKAQRQALLAGYALLWKGDLAMEQPWPEYPIMTGLQFMIGEADESPLPAGHLIDWRVEMPAVSVEEAVNLWNIYVPASKEWPEGSLKEMARKHSPNIGQLLSVAKRNCSTIDEASDVIRGLSRHRLGDLAKQINSSFTWDDLIIPSNLRKDLDDFYFEATDRSQVWELSSTRRLFPQGRGLMALFTGSPGTGKTMAAQVIANSLQLDLFRIDLSSMVSKYIGETSKNIHRILSRAERMDAVLLFDEADALFGKRTDVKDAHDRYANTDTNYLLQAIEEYPGIAILASNRKAGIDPGFTRRLRYVLEFPRPDAMQRHLLWNNLLSGLTGVGINQELDQDLKRLSAVADVTGAQIKMAVLSALFMARREKKEISITHVLRGLERELIKDGRGMGKQVNDIMKQQHARERMNGK
ncbi:MAG: AAA family ATPase [Chitinophagaceae bacterium]|nr:AAA family ATPase [Chitinophagaceae bacterium]